MFGHLVLVFDESRAGEISLQVGFEKVKDVLNISPMNHFSRRFVAIPSSKPKQLHVTKYELLHRPKPDIFRRSRWAFMYQTAGSKTQVWIKRARGRFDKSEAWHPQRRDRDIYQSL